MSAIGGGTNTGYARVNRPDYPHPADYIAFTPGELIALHVGWPSGSDTAIEKLVARALVATAPATRRSSIDGSSWD